MRGVFTISLDFELHWGGVEKWGLRVPPACRQAGVPGSMFQVPDLYFTKPETRNTKLLPAGRQAQPATFNQYFINTRKVIPEMLGLFEKYDIHVTWAGVGMLMHKNRESLIKNFPSQLPSYENKELSAYNYIDEVGIGASEEDDPFHYADSLVRQIINTKHQELGSHSFSHFYCNEDGQTVEQFRADLQSAQKAASAYGIKFRSLVFPRNQFNDEYLKVCYEEGFECVRSNPLDWFWKINSTENESKWKRLNRGLDAYFSIGKKNTYPVEDIEVRRGFPVCLPASRLLRPYRPTELFLNRLKIDRIKSEMKRAAEKNEVYHLWWHPHNFGHYPEQSLKALEQILKAYKNCHAENGMTSLHMGELTDHIKSSHEKKAAA